LETLLQMKNISKSFAAVKALNDVNFDLHTGEVHALMGENGAGKSTLMNILSGGISFFDGDIFIEGQRVHIKTPVQAQRLGIAKIHQELQLVPYMTVAENIYMGREKSRFGFVSDTWMNKEAAECLAQLEVNIDPSTLVKDLRVGEQQMVEIAKALNMHSKILIMDEPTSAISKAETGHLFTVINKLKAQGVGIIYITHRMEEVFLISDRLTVMRDGVYVDTVNAKESSEEKIISMMVGRDIKAMSVKNKDVLGKEVMRVENLNFSPKEGSFKRSLKDVSFTIHAGEVVGIAGLMGAGRTELCECVFGVHPKTSTGNFYIENKKVNLRSPGDAINHGISFATEDRKSQGLVLQRSIGENMSLPLLKLFSKLGFMQVQLEKKRWVEKIRQLNIKTPSSKTLAGALSGGNQQKVILGRWLLTNPKLLILDEPTRGIDVGAKSEIYKLIDQLAEQGMAILVVSSEMPELIALSDRVIVLCEGRITGGFLREDITQEKLLMAATRMEGNK